MKQKRKVKNLSLKNCGVSKPGMIGLGAILLGILCITSIGLVGKSVMAGLESNPKVLGNLGEKAGDLGGKVGDLGGKVGDLGGKVVEGEEFKGTKVSTNTISILLGGSNNEIHAGSNLIAGGQNNKIFSSSVNSSILGGSDNNISGKNAIVGGVNVKVGENVSDVFVFHNDGTNNDFTINSNTSSNTFYLDTEGVGINTDTATNGVGALGAVGFGEINIESNSCNSNNYGLQGTWNGCLMGCTRNGWQLLDSSDYCKEECEETDACYYFEEPYNPESKAGECVGLLHLDNDRMTYCPDQHPEKYYDTMFEEVLVNNGECPSNSVNSDLLTNQCVYQCNSEFHLKVNNIDFTDGNLSLTSGSVGCYKDCGWGTGKIEHGDTVIGYEKDPVYCAYKDNDPINPKSVYTCSNHENKATLMCVDGTLYITDENGNPYRRNNNRYTKTSCTLNSYNCESSYNLRENDIMYGFYPNTGVLPRNDREEKELSRGKYKLCIDYKNSGDEECNPGSNPYHYKLVECNEGFTRFGDECRKDCTDKYGNLRPDGTRDIAYKSNSVYCPYPIPNPNLKCEEVNVTCTDGKWLDGNGHENTTRDCTTYSSYGCFGYDISHLIYNNLLNSIYSSNTQYYSSCELNKSTDDNKSCEGDTNYKFNGCPGGYSAFSVDLVGNSTAQICQENPVCGENHYECNKGKLVEGSDSAVEDGDTGVTTYRWKCIGEYGLGTPDNCEQGVNPTPINGQCGNEVNTCSGGNFEDIQDTDTEYKWMCKGRYNGGDAECSKPIPPTSVNGQCGNDVNTCSEGNFSDIADTDTEYKWMCEGISGGDNAECSKKIPTYKCGGTKPTGGVDMGAEYYTDSSHTPNNWGNGYKDPKVMINQLKACEWQCKSGYVINPNNSMNCMEKPSTCTITYDSNGGTPTPLSQTVTCGTSITLASAPSRTDCTWGKWKSSKDGNLYSAGSSYTLSENVTMTAQWSCTHNCTGSQPGNNTRKSTESPSSTTGWKYVSNTNATLKACEWTCNENYEREGNSMNCKPKIQTGTCTGRPANATWVNDKFKQTWNGSDWTPSSKSAGATCGEPSSVECSFKCNNGYGCSTDKTKCEQYMCISKPANSEKDPFVGISANATSNVPGRVVAYDYTPQQGDQCLYHCDYNNFYYYDNVLKYCRTVSDPCNEYVAHKCNEGEPINTRYENHKYTWDCEFDGHIINTGYKCELCDDGSLPDPIFGCDFGSQGHWECKKDVLQAGYCESIGKGAWCNRHVPHEQCWVHTPHGEEILRSGICTTCYGSCPYDCQKRPNNKPLPQCCYGQEVAMIYCPNYNSISSCNSQQFCNRNYGDDYDDTYYICVDNDGNELSDRDCPEDDYPDCSEIFPYEGQCESSGACPVTADGEKCTSYDGCTKIVSTCNNGEWSITPGDNETKPSNCGCSSSGVCPAAENGTQCISYNGCAQVTSECIDGSWSPTPGYTINKPSSCTSSNGGGGGGCFLSGTPVITSEGPKNIEDIQVGDMVLSYNTISLKTEYNKVTKLLIHEDNDDELYELTIDGNLLKTTSVHPFFVVNDNENDYQCNMQLKLLYARDLRVGDMLLMSDGRYATIEKIEHHHNHSTVYNLEVENIHNYFVGEGYLVHNAIENWQNNSVMMKVDTDPGRDGGGGCGTTVNAFQNENGMLCGSYNSCDGSYSFLGC